MLDLARRIEIKLHAGTGECRGRFDVAAILALARVLRRSDDPVPVGVKVWWRRAYGYAQRLCIPVLAGPGGPSPQSVGGHLFCFRGRRGDLIKVIWHDGKGACLFVKRLEKGRFLWPLPADGVIGITPAQMGYLLSGIDWRNPVETLRPTSVG